MNSQPQRTCPVCGNLLKPHDTTYDHPHCRRQAEHLPPPRVNFTFGTENGWQSISQGAYRRYNTNS